MKKTANLLLILFSLVFLQSCDDEQFDASGFNYVSFAPSPIFSVPVAGTTTVNITVLASNSGAARTIPISVDASGASAGSYSVPTSVTMGAGETEATIAVTLNDVNLGLGTNNLVLSFGDGLTEGVSSGSSTTVRYIQFCDEVSATFDIVFDRWGSEVSWSVNDSDGGVVVSGGGYPDTAGTATDTALFSLCRGRTFTLTTTDAFGDGWGAVGSYILTVDGTVEVNGDGSLMDNGGNGSISSTVPFDTL